MFRYWLEGAWKVFIRLKKKKKKKEKKKGGKKQSGREKKRRRLGENEGETKIRQQKRIKLE